MEGELYHEEGRRLEEEAEAEAAELELRLGRSRDVAQGLRAKIHGTSVIFASPFSASSSVILYCDSCFGA